ncbi:MAG: sugar diacid recognition domain-containing protein [Anaerovoracaceae bacterium]|jgi:carbohydrate diacid regulator
MHLSRATAKQLLDEVSSIIDFDIYISDEIGFIIASTNEERVNEYHVPSYRIVTEHLSELIVHTEDEYPGCHVGINLPLMLNGEIAGVIGITGPVDEVEPYGKILQMLLELLLQNIDTLQRQKTSDQDIMFFVNEWLSGELVDRKKIETNAAKYDLDLNKTMAVAVITREAQGDTGAFMEQKFNDAHVIHSLNSNDRSMGIVIMNAESIEDVREYFESKFDSMFPASAYRVAIGSVTNSSNIRNSYLEARKIDTIVEKGKPGIFDYNLNILDVAINGIPSEYKRLIIDKTFMNCRSDEIREIAEFIVTYFKNNGSISAMAEELFLHKNTVQYKIKRIKKKTGLDLRHAREMMELYFAAIWYLENADRTDV